MPGYLPSSLAPVSAVEVVDLRRVDADRVDQFMRRETDAPGVRMEGDAARRIASLWRALPPGEQSRCHVPPFGLRFLSGDEVICRASICWECGNIFGDQSGRRVHYAFDEGDPISRALRVECRRAVGEPKDFRRRATYAPDSVYRHRLRGWEYIPIHPFADEVETLLRLDMKPADCLAVDAWWSIDGVAALVQAQVGRPDGPPHGLYARSVDREEADTDLSAIVDADRITRATFEALLGRFADLGFPDVGRFRLPRGGGLVRLGDVDG